MDSNLVRRVRMEAHHVLAHGVQQLALLHIVHVVRGPARGFDWFGLSGLNQFWFGERTVLVPLLLVPFVPRHVRSAQQSGEWSAC